MGKPTYTEKQTRYDGIYRRTYASGRVSFLAVAPGWTSKDGKRHQPKRSFDTVEAARDWRAEQISRSAKGIRADAGKLTLGHYLEGWLEQLKLTDYKPNTKALYRQQLTKHLLSQPIAGARLREVTPKLVSDAYANMPRGNVRYVHGALHRALQDAVPDLIPANPAARAVRPRRKARGDASSAWTLDELARFLDHVAAIAHRDAAAYRVLAYTGVRIGELLGLEWRDVDIDAGKLHVRQQWHMADSKAVLEELKTAHSRREIDLDADTVEQLREHRKQQLAQRMKAGSAWNTDHDYVFTTEIGEPHYPNSFRRRFETAVRDAGVRRIRIHDVRHTHATDLIRSGVSPEYVRQRLGHADVSITLSIYAHVFPQDGASAVALFADRLAKAASDSKVTPLRRDA